MAEKKGGEEMKAFIYAILIGLAVATFVNIRFLMIHAEALNAVEQRLTLVSGFCKNQIVLNDIQTKINELILTDLERRVTESPQYY